MLLCEYKDILGKPGEGFHSRRIGGFALGDIIGTIIIGIIIAIVFHVNIFAAVFGTFAVGTFMHWLFCVDTTFMHLLRSAS